MKISKIKIDSSFAKFEDGEILDLSTLSEKNQNRVFIYGSNGAGKSSLSKLFSIGNMKLDGNLDYQNRLSLLKTTNNDNPLSVKIYYNEEDYTEFNNDIIRPKRIPVFNKDYIDSKITYQTDFKNNKFDQQESTYSIELESKTNYHEKLKEFTRNKEKLDELELKINNEIMSGINETTKDTGTTKANKIYMEEYNFTQFISLSAKSIPTSNLDKLRLEHQQFIKNLKDLTEEDIIEFEIKEFDKENKIQKRIDEINKTIKFNEDKSKLDFVKKYLDRYSDEEREWKIKGAILLGDADKCPFCEQNIKDIGIVESYKNYVNSSTKKVENFIEGQIEFFKNSNNVVNNYIEGYILKAKNVDKIFNTNIAEDIDLFIKELMNFNKRVIELLNKKLNPENLYIDCSDILEEIDFNLFEELEYNYNNLVKKIEDINRKVTSNKNEKDKRNREYLRTTGKYIIYNKIRDEIKEYNSLKIKDTLLSSETGELKSKYQKDIQEKNELLKTINSILDEFNITNYRVDENFDIFLNDYNVSTNVEKMLSDGEKNMIAFALFAAELKLLYTESEKEIIFIDDPITSVDYPNLYNIYNYLVNIIEENKSSQIFITSHNIVFLNMLKFRYSKEATYYKLYTKHNKTYIKMDDCKYDSIYLEKLKEIYKISKENEIDKNQKLYIHNYCRYVLETLSRFEYPDHNNDADSSREYIKNLKKDIKNGKVNLSISEKKLDSLLNIINKGSHATLDVVHDGEIFTDEHYINACKQVINIIHAKYEGQYQLLTNSYSSDDSKKEKISKK